MEREFYYKEKLCYCTYANKKTFVFDIEIQKYTCTLVANQCG